MDDPLGLASVWTTPEPEPTNLVAPWPDDDAPDAESLGAAIARAIDAAIDVDTLPTPAPEIVELLIVRSEQLARPVVVWCERARGSAPPQFGERAAQASWVLGIETTLDRNDPLTGYTRLLEMLTRLRPELPAVLDVNTGLWRGQEMLRLQFAADAVEPPADSLWMVQIIERAGETSCGLRTVGLHRCGRPELELLEVPRTHVRGAAELLNDLTALLLETEHWPTPGALFEIGPDLRVALQPAPVTTRRPDDPGPAIAVCDAEHADVSGPTWPRAAVTAIERGETAIYRAARTSRRQAELAKVTWTRLLRALQHASSPGEEVQTMVEAGFDTDDGSREHLWFTADEVEEDQLAGTLAHTPACLTSLRAGQSMRLHRELVSDWIVRTRDRRFGPDDIGSLERWVRGDRGGDG